MNFRKELNCIIKKGITGTMPDISAITTESIIVKFRMLIQNKLLVTMLLHAQFVFSKISPVADGTKVLF